MHLHASWVHIVRSGHFEQHGRRRVEAAIPTAELVIYNSLLLGADEVLGFGDDIGITDQHSELLIVTGLDPKESLRVVIPPP